MWARVAPNARCTHVYLEGDGYAWRTRNRASSDPTPVDPIGLRLAARDKSGATVVYLGRPCQYLDESAPQANACRPILWTNARYGDAVVDALNQQLDRVVEGAGKGVIRIVGYSGGGVLAALLAARRTDVAAIATIAAPLDVDAWTTQSGVTPLYLSKRPMDEVEWLRGVRQDHFNGGADAIAPAETTRRFVRAGGTDAPVRVHVWPEMTHRGWPARWGEASSALWGGCEGATVEAL